MGYNSNRTLAGAESKPLSPWRELGACRLPSTPGLGRPSSPSAPLTAQGAWMADSSKGAAWQVPVAVGRGWAGTWKPGQVLEAAGSEWSSAESPRWSAATFTGHQSVCSRARGPGKPTTPMPCSRCCAVVQGTKQQERSPRGWVWPPRLCSRKGLCPCPTRGTGDTKAQSGSQPKVCRHRGNVAAGLRAPGPGKTLLLLAAGRCWFCFRHRTPFAGGLKRQPQPSTPSKGDPRRLEGSVWPVSVHSLRPAPLSGKCDRKVELSAAVSLPREGRHLNVQGPIGRPSRSINSLSRRTKSSHSPAGWDEAPDCPVRNGDGDGEAQLPSLQRRASQHSPGGRLFSPR